MTVNVACAALAAAPTTASCTDNCGNDHPDRACHGRHLCRLRRHHHLYLTYTDCEGNTHDWVYTYTIEVKTSPCRPMTASTVACAAVATAPTPPVVNDNCGDRSPRRAVTGGTYALRRHHHLYLDLYRL